MNFKFRHTERIVGFFVFSALAILIAGILLISFSRKLFVETYTFNTLLSDAGGLSSATPLIFKGYEIGRVKNFTMNEDNNIGVELEVYKEFREKIVLNATIYRQVNPITGKMSLILLYPKLFPAGFAKNKSGSLVLPEGRYIPSLDMRDGQILLENNIIERSGDVISILFEDARDFVSNMREEFKLKKDSFKTVFGNFGEFSESLMRNKEIFDHLNQLLSPSTSPIFKSVEGFAEVAERLKNAADRLNEMLENYKNPDGLMLKMFEINQNQLNQALENLNTNLKTLHDLFLSLKDQTPLIGEVLDKTDKTLEAINNNPLLRGGISRDKTNTNSSKKKRMDIDQ